MTQSSGFEYRLANHLDGVGILAIASERNYFRVQIQTSIDQCCEAIIFLPACIHGSAPDFYEALFAGFHCTSAHGVGPVGTECSCE